MRARDKVALASPVRTIFFLLIGLVLGALLFALLVVGLARREWVLPVLSFYALSAIVGRLHRIDQHRGLDRLFKRFGGGFQENDIDGRVRIATRRGVSSVGEWKRAFTTSIQVGILMGIHLSVSYLVCHLPLAIVFLVVLWIAMSSLFLWTIDRLLHGWLSGSCISDDG